MAKVCFFAKGDKVQVQYNNLIKMDIHKKNKMGVSNLVI